MTSRQSQLLPWLSVLVVLPLAALSMAHPSLSDAGFILLFIPLLWADLSASAIGAIIMTAIVAAARVVLEQVHESFYHSRASVTEFLFSAFSPIAVYVFITAVLLAYRHRQWRLQQQLLAKERLEAMGQLAGGLAHDFNNVLSVIQGTAQLMQDNPSLDESAQTDLNTILDATRRGAGLVGQFMGIRHAQQPAREIIDLNQLVVDSRRHVQPAIGPQMALEVRLHNQPLPVYANPMQLHQVILNLCTNARDAMDNVGRITLATHRREVDTHLAQRKAVKPGEYAVLAVVDTGHGMSPKTLTRIFKPFFTTKGPDRGTGLGLAVVDSIVRGHGGFIQVESELGKGARFEIHLPIRTAAPGQTATASAL